MIDDVWEISNKNIKNSLGKQFNISNHFLFIIFNLKKDYKTTKSFKLERPVEDAKK